jgi:hypothetical protein
MSSTNAPRDRSFTGLFIPCNSVHPTALAGDVRKFQILIAAELLGHNRAYFLILSSVADELLIWCFGPSIISEAREKSLFFVHHKVICRFGFSCPLNNLCLVTNAECKYT